MSLYLVMKMPRPISVVLWYLVKLLPAKQRELMFEWGLIVGVRWREYFFLKFWRNLTSLIYSIACVPGIFDRRHYIHNCEPLMIVTSSIVCGHTGSNHIIYIQCSSYQVYILQVQYSLHQWNLGAEDKWRCFYYDHDTE